MLLMAGSLPTYTNVCVFVSQCPTVTQEGILGLGQDPRGPLTMPPPYRRVVNTLTTLTHTCTQALTRTLTHTHTSPPGTDSSVSPGMLSIIAPRK